jgi:Ni/Fe-hydrogenase subunit HybB-like protein
MCAAFQGFIKDQASTWVDPCFMATGTDFKAHLAVMAALFGVAAMLRLQWRVSAERAWSYGVYYVGYRLLSVQLTCGSLAVSALPLVAEHA